jgi:hypothetical protein
MYEARLGPDDRRIELDGRVYYVRAVKWKRDFTRGLPQPVGWWLADIVRLVADGLRRVRAGRRPWMVGVIRIGDVSSWNDVEPNLEHHEALTAGQSPQARIAELAHEAQQGAFAS